MMQVEGSNTDQGGEECLVILNHKLEGSDIHRFLNLKANKLRGAVALYNLAWKVVSTGTLPYTCLFPKSSVAFMVLPASDVTAQWPPSDSYSLSTALSQNLAKFNKLHHKGYFLLSAPILTDVEQKLLMVLQQQYMGYDIQFLPVHNATEAVECMLSIAKVTSKPLSDVIMTRLAHIEKRMLSEEKIHQILSGVGLNKHCAVVMLDGCGSLARVAKASCHSDELMEYGVKCDQAEDLKSLFNSKH